MKGDVRARYRGCACPPISLQHVAVDKDLPLAEGAEIDDAAQSAADQPLDLLCPARLSPFGCLPAHSLGRRTREQRVLGRHPSLTSPAHPSRDVLVDRSRAQNLGPA